MTDPLSQILADRASGETRRPCLKALYLPAMLLGINGAGMILAAPGGGRLWLLVPLGLVAVALTLVVERLIPYEPDWNLSRGETRRDVTHAVVNQSIQVVGVGALPVLAWVVRIQGPWPSRWPFVAQVAMAIATVDAGITLIHYAAHHVLALWRFHAAHHSVTRFYGFNGLLEHPINTFIDMLAAVPLIIAGLPARVAAIVAFCAAVQLLLQHSNADYPVGRLRYFLALNEAHRFHHLKSATEGNVNFGLFTLIWDHLLGTFADDPNRHFASADLGIEQWPHYPTGYLAQLIQPFVDEASLTATPVTSYRHVPVNPAGAGSGTPDLADNNA